MGGPMTVLVAEDDHRIAAMLAKGLRSRHHDVEVVVDGGGALARLAADRFDVLLLDLGLPDIDGLEVLRRLAGSGSSVPVIVITARSDPTDREAAIELGAAAYLTKPFAWADLWAALDECVGAR